MKKSEFRKGRASGTSGALVGLVLCFGLAGCGVETSPSNGLPPDAAVADADASVEDTDASVAGVDAGGALDHSLLLGGVAHQPNNTDPLKNCVGCHGAQLKGGSGPSCYDCHNAADHTVNHSGAKHRSGTQSSCTKCHGPSNTGGLGPACSNCH